MWDIELEEDLRAFDFYKATEGGNVARSRMNQAALLENPGWATHFWPRDRGDLYLCLDDGWDVPARIDAGTERWRFGSLVLNSERFPDFTGAPAERLRRLNEQLRSVGWRGLALWVAAQCEGDGRDGKLAGASECESYWRERARWSARAGIEYWKVDWGVRCGDAPFRRTLTRVAREEAPHLTIEHACCMPPVNNIPGSGRFAAWTETLKSSTEILSFSDVFRSYDAIWQIGIPTTLDRINAWMRQVRMEPDARGIINCEDAVYLGAAMGFALGILRVPVRNAYTQGKWPRADEASRAIRWQRLAPAFGVAFGKARASDRELTDSFLVGSDFWDRRIAGKEIEQYAPAVMCRGAALPRVACDGEPPYVVASKNPNRAVAIAVLPRCLHSKEERPLADVELDLDDIVHPIGVFGKFRTLTLRCPPAFPAKRVWAQDLLADEAEDVTKRVRFKGDTMILDGPLINEVGLSAATKDDPSDPGLVLRMEN